jgi:hypothetical protein
MSIFRGDSIRPDVPDSLPQVAPPPPPPGPTLVQVVKPEEPKTEMVEAWKYTSSMEAFHKAHQRIARLEKRVAAKDQQIVKLKARLYDLLSKGEE